MVLVSGLILLICALIEVSVVFIIAWRKDWFVFPLVSGWQLAMPDRPAQIRIFSFNLASATYFQDNVIIDTKGRVTESNFFNHEELGLILFAHLLEIFWKSFPNLIFAV